MARNFLKVEILGSSPNSATTIVLANAMGFIFDLPQIPNQEEFPQFHKWFSKTSQFRLMRTVGLLRVKQIRNLRKYWKHYTKKVQTEIHNGNKLDNNI